MAGSISCRETAERASCLTCSAHPRPECPHGNASYDPTWPKDHEYQRISSWAKDEDEEFIFELLHETSVRPGFPHHGRNVSCEVGGSEGQKLGDNECATDGDLAREEQRCDGDTSGEE